MNRTSITTALAAAAFASALVACGGGGSKNNPDAGHGVDSGHPTDGHPTTDSGPTTDSSTTVDASSDATQVTCTPTVLGAQDIATNDAANGYIAWKGPVTTDLGDGGPADFGIEFYDPMMTTNVVAAIDLSTGAQADYATCVECVTVFSSDAMGNLAHTYFQSGGTMTMTADPYMTETMKGMITNLALVEVTIDPMTLHATLVPGGKCLTVGTVVLDHTAVPNAWTCAPAKYKDGTTCDCACGLSDPDCAKPAVPVAGCTGNDVCPADVCLTWTCATTAYNDGANCDCNCGQVDPDCAISGAPVVGCTAGQTCPADACVTPAPPPANDTCATATPLALGTPLAGTTVSAANNYDTGLNTATCTNDISSKGGDVVYSITLTSGTAYTFALTGVDAAFDPSIALLGPGTPAAVCDIATVNCLAGADVGLEGAGETFSFTPTMTGTYYVIVDSFYAPATESGAFTVKVTSP